MVILIYNVNNCSCSSIAEAKTWLQIHGLLRLLLETSQFFNPDTSSEDSFLANANEYEQLDAHVLLAAHGWN